MGVRGRAAVKAGETRSSAAKAEVFCQFTLEWLSANHFQAKHLQLKNPNCHLLELGIYPQGLVHSREVLPLSQLLVCYS